MIRSWLSNGGALMTDEPIEGITQEMKPEEESYYGGKYFIGETITGRAAQKISEALGLQYEGRREK